MVNDNGYYKKISNNIDVYFRGGDKNTVIRYLKILEIVMVCDDELPKLIQALQQVQKMKESGE